MTGKNVDQIKADVASPTTADQVTANSGALTNTFDANKVQREIDLQMRVTQEFDANRQQVRASIGVKEASLRREAEGETDRLKRDALLMEADKVQKQGILFDSIANALGGPNSNGAVGAIANFAAPQLAYQIGQYFKNTDKEASSAHILAHGILGAALSAATGGNAISGALSGAGAEALAPIIGKWLYGVTDPSDLSADQRSTIASITSLGAAGLGLASGHNGMSVAGNAEIAGNAVDNNYLTKNQMTNLVSELEKCKRNYDVLACSAKVRDQYEEISKSNDRALMAVCDSNLGGAECKKRIKDALNYTTATGAQAVGKDDIKRSALIVLDRVLNSPNAKDYLTRNIDDIDSRADFFHAMSVVFPSSQWFRVAENTSRDFVAGLGAEGRGSFLSYFLGNQLTDARLYDWRSEAGNALMSGGFDNFKTLFNSPRPNFIVWDITQLLQEQSLLQPVHEKYLGNVEFRLIPIEAPKLFKRVNVLDYKSRVNYGCREMGYTASQGCKP